MNTIDNEKSNNFFDPDTTTSQNQMASVQFDNWENRFHGTLVPQNESINIYRRIYSNMDTTRRVHPLMDITCDPAINVMDMDTFRYRVSQIFQIVSDVLAKSYGPYGSSTIISDYPFKHVTKDGFSIMKKLSFSKDKTIIDDAIKGLIEGPCARLNYAVGDGTTTSIIAVNAIYQQYEQKFCNSEFSKEYPPRDILKAYEKVRDEIISALNDEIEVIDIENHDKMVSEMTKIANISSNADNEITSLIHDLYDELDYPLIEIVKAKDGITKKTVTHGYQYKALLKDAVYVTTDNMTGEYKNLDVLIFDHKVSTQTFTHIINPLNVSCSRMGRNLLVIAPSYDEVAMMDEKRILMGEKQATGKINLILITGSMVNGLSRNLTEDLAMLLNTTIINMSYERELIELLTKGSDILEVCDISNRHIKGINIPEKTHDGKNFTWRIDDGESFEPCIDLVENALRVGFVSDATLGMSMDVGSVFKGFFYNEDIYNKTITMLDKKLEEVGKKSESISAFNFEAKDIQTRLFNLKMNIGRIEVGGESVLSQDLLYDAVDDTVKATASAYHNGIVKGCSVSTLRSIMNIRKKERSELENILLEYIMEGFREVYKTLLGSKYTNDWFVYNDLHLSSDEYKISNSYDTITNHTNWNVDFKTYRDYMYKANEMFDTCSDNIFDTIINISIASNLPFDLTTGTFNPSIINSAKTDKEVLLASSDLISLLITGNQFILADHD